MLTVIASAKRKTKSMVETNFESREDNFDVSGKKFFLGF